MAAKLCNMFISYIKLNIRSQMEYRFSFVCQFLFMFINDIFLLFFWWIFFSGFSETNGWNLKDVFLLYAISAGVFGIAAVFFGNCFSLSKIIYSGELDSYLTNPAPLLFHILISRSIIAGWGDLLFSVIAFSLAGHYSLYSCIMYIAGLAIGSAVFISFSIIVNSFSFFIGNAESLSNLMREATLTFSLYPGNLFSGMVKICLFTILPAGFIAYIPVSLIKNFNILDLVSVIGFASALMISARYVFYSGMKRYSSGGLMGSKM